MQQIKMWLIVREHYYNFSRMKHPFLFLLVLPLSALAQPDSTSMKVDLDTVRVFSQQRASSYSELTRMVGVVTRGELLRMKSTSLSEILERSASIDIRQRGAHGVQSDINFRGGSFDQTLVMLNDVNISDPQTGHHNLNIPIVLDAVSRIEILQGPGARELGQGAFSGAINIITEPSAINEFSISTFAGEYGLLKTSASATFGSAKIRTFTAASFDRSNGYTDNTDFTGENFFLHTLFRTGVGEFSLFSGYQDKGFGANSFYTPKYPNQFEATRTMLSGLKYRHTFGRTSIAASGYYRKNYDRFELFRNNPPSWYPGHNYHTTDVYGLKASMSFLYGFGKIEAGAEIRREEILSTNLGEALSDSVRVKGRDAWYTKGGNRDLLNIFTSQTFYLKRVTLSGGLQLAYNSSFDYIWCWGADISYSLNNHSRLFASANRSYRVPTFTDLYYSSPTNVGNPNLKPEYAVTVEGGLKANSRGWSVQLAMYYRQGSNIIDWVKEPTDEVWHTVNHTSLNTVGVEVFMQADLSEVVRDAGSINFSYSFASAEKNEDGKFDSYYAMDYLRHNLRVTINQQFLKRLTLNLCYHFMARAGEFQDFSTKQIRKFPSIHLADVRLTYNAKSMLEVFIDVSNIFNNHYMDVANVMQAGRWVGAGINLRFGL